MGGFWIEVSRVLSNQTQKIFFFDFKLSFLIRGERLAITISSPSHLEILLILQDKTVL